jgi:hypothetical protein
MKGTTVMTDAVITPVVAPADQKHKRKRSPGYPAINLAQAIKRTDEFYRAANRNAISFTATANAWDYAIKSSGALTAVAALKSFGLLDEVEAGSGRTFKVSSLGLKIVADKRPNSEERDAAIREAALRPKIHADIWRNYNGSIPIDVELQYRLENDWEFNINAIPAVIKEFKETISFAKLTASDTLSEGDGDTDGEKPPLPPPNVKVGDFVQWEPRGILQFKEPRKVVKIDTFDNGHYVFVEGSAVGMPMSEVKLEEPPPPPDPLKVPLIESPLPPSSGGGSGGGSVTTMRQDVFSVDEGDVILRWPTPLSADSLELVKLWLDIVPRKLGIAPAPKSSLQCECAGCSNAPTHASGMRCAAKAGGSGAQFCGACEAARKIDAEQFAQTFPPR